MGTAPQPIKKPAADLGGWYIQVKAADPIIKRPLLVHVDCPI